MGSHVEISTEFMVWAANIAKKIDAMNGEPKALDYYVSEVRVACDGNYVGRFLGVDDFMYFQPGPWFGGDQPEPVDAEGKTIDTVNHQSIIDAAIPSIRSGYAEAIAHELMEVGNAAMPDTPNHKSFAHGYTKALDDLFQILGFTPDDFEGVRDPYAV